jgi:hypothetical protein
MERKTEEYVKKKIIAQSLIEKIKSENQDSVIKTNVVEGYKKPYKILKKENQQTGFVPDVISEEKGGKTDLYEIELDERNYVLDKWRLFSLYSKKTRGSFSIVTPESKMDLLKDMLKLNQIRAKIIYFS